MLDEYELLATLVSSSKCKQQQQEIIVLHRVQLEAQPRCERGLLRGGTCLIKHEGQRFRRVWWQRSRLRHLIAPAIMHTFHFPLSLFPLPTHRDLPLYHPLPSHDILAAHRERFPRLPKEYPNMPSRSNTADSCASDEYFTPRGRPANAVSSAGQRCKPCKDKGIAVSALIIQLFPLEFP